MLVGDIGGTNARLSVWRVGAKKQAEEVHREVRVLRIWWAYRVTCAATWCWLMPTAADDARDESRTCASVNAPQCMHPRHSTCACCSGVCTCMARCTRASVPRPNLLIHILLIHPFG